MNHTQGLSIDKFINNSVTKPFLEDIQVKIVSRNNL